MTFKPIYPVVFSIFCVVTLSLMLLSAVEVSQEFSLLMPFCVMVGIAVIFFWKLNQDDRRLPISDVGSFYVLAILAYGALPLLGHWLSGMELTVLSHKRLYLANPSPEEFASIGWLHVVFMIAFTIPYIYFRKANVFVENQSLILSTNALKRLCVVFLLLEGYFVYLKIFAGIDFSTAYDSSLYDHAAKYGQLSIINQQFIAHPWGMLTVVKMALVVWLTSKWRSSLHRNILLAVLTFIILSYLQAPGGRYAIISIFLTVVIAYHQFIQPIKLGRATFYSILLVAAFFAANMYRGQDTSDINLALSVMKEASGGSGGLYSIANEFQISYGSIIELKKNLENSALGNIPWQVNFYDVLFVIPQQLLPFDKIDPVVWYTQLTGNPDYFNYGVICESMVGFGLIEIIIRGIVMGVFLAKIHNWFVNRANNFWVALFYIWLSIVIYQSFRNTSMHFLPLFLFQWLPVFVLEMIFINLFWRQHRSLTVKRF